MGERLSLHSSPYKLCPIFPQATDYWKNSSYNGLHFIVFNLNSKMEEKLFAKT
jgi:hypothetical protein